MNAAVFNPSHELALEANRKNFTPPQQVRRMESDLSLFSLVWQTDGREPEVWGWNLAVREQLKRAGVSPGVLPTDDELEQWRTFSHRAFAAHYLTTFFEELKDFQDLENLYVGSTMCFTTSLAALPVGTDETIIVKMPFSSSGRGNVVGKLIDSSFREQVTKLMTKHGGVLVDRFYKKVLDFALEYEVRVDGTVIFLGYSVFEASTKGSYGGNVVDSQPNLKERINELLPFDVASIVEIHRSLLQQHFAGRYRGYVGIDMMVVDDGAKRKVHPCVEMNLRMNMGIAAMRLYEKLQLLSHLVAEGATYEQCLQRKNLGFLRFLSGTDFSRFHFEDLNHLLRSSMRLPLSPMRDCGFHAFLQSGRLSIAFS